MDPQLIDLLWEVHREVGSKQAIWIVCGYRSPETNSMLRRRSSGVAKFSQHTLGKAIDFYIPGVALEELRAAGLRAQRGGVGFYPSSNFVHLDTGSVRHWPRMPEAQLARVMAKGPLTQVASRSQEPKVATASVANPLAKLFGIADDDHAEPTVSTTTADAKAAKSAPKAENKVAAVPVPTARPATGPTAEPAGFDLASASSRPVQVRPAQPTSLLNRGDSANTVISERGFWQGLPDTEALQASVAAKASAPAQRPAGTKAAAGADATGSQTPWPLPTRGEEPALAYAPVAHPAAQSRAPAAAAARPTPAAAQRDTTVAVKRTGNQPTLVSSPAPEPEAVPPKFGQRFNDPWMRAMIVAPSAGAFMSTSLLGSLDYRVLGPYLRKPESAIMMTFAPDPYLGMTTDRFSGNAVVFVSTVTFRQRTASLR